MILACLVAVIAFAQPASTHLFAGNWVANI